MEKLVPALFVIGIIATLSPLVSRIPIGFRMPIVVVEILLGIIVGPHVLGWVPAAPELKFFGYLGMVFLFFMAGAEIKEHPVQGRPLWLGTAGWVVSFIGGIVIAFALYYMGVVDAPLFVATALCTTALGALIPIMRDAEELSTKFGQYILGAGALGELGPIIVLASVLLGNVILTESTLSFLGMGIQEPTASWGTMIAKGNEYLTFAPWISLFPGFFLFLTMIAFNLLGDGLRDHLDPRGGSVV